MSEYNIKTFHPKTPKSDLLWLTLLHRKLERPVDQSDSVLDVQAEIFTYTYIAAAFCHIWKYIYENQ